MSGRETFAPARMVVARNMRRFRRAAGLSQAAAAEAVGVRRETVTEIEARRRSVRAEELPAFARAYSVPVERLLHGTETL